MTADDEERIRQLERRLDRYDTLYSVGKSTAIALISIGGAIMWLLSTAREWMAALRHP